MVDNFASLFNCTTVDRSSDWMTASSSICFKQSVPDHKQDHSQAHRGHVCGVFFLVPLHLLLYFITLFYFTCFIVPVSVFIENHHQTVTLTSCCHWAWTAYHLTAEYIDKWVRKFSSEVLSMHEQKVLSKGLNFAITPDNVPVIDFILVIEQASWSLDLEKRTSCDWRLQVFSRMSDWPVLISQKWKDSQLRTCKSLIYSNPSSR